MKYPPSSHPKQVEVHDFLEQPRYWICVGTLQMSCVLGNLQRKDVEIQWKENERGWELTVERRQESSFSFWPRLQFLSETNYPPCLWSLTASSTWALFNWSLNKGTSILDAIFAALPAVAGSLRSYLPAPDTGNMQRMKEIWVLRIQSKTLS